MNVASRPFRFHHRTHAVAVVAVLCVAPAIIAQWQVDHRVPGGISGMGTVRYVQSSSQLLPSESRYQARAAGYLPSENRMRYLDAGPGQSFSRLRSPISPPVAASAEVYSPLSTIRYGGMTPGTLPGPSAHSYAAPMAAPATGNRFGGPPTTIRYSGPSLPSPTAPAPMDFGTTRPIATPSPYGSPGTIRYAGGYR